MLRNTYWRRKKGLGDFMKKKIRTDICVVIAAGLLTLVFIIMNLNNSSFWQASCMDIVTMWFVGILTIIISENGSERRHVKASMEHVIDEVERYVVNDANFTFEHNEMAFFEQASCANKIKYLKDANFSDIKDDIDFINNHFGEIRDLYSNHNNSKDSLDSVKKDIKRHRVQIIDKCDKIRIELCK